MGYLGLAVDLKLLAIALRVPLGQQLQPSFNPDAARCRVLGLVVGNLKARVGNLMVAATASARDASSELFVLIHPVINCGLAHSLLAAQLAQRGAVGQALGEYVFKLCGADCNAHA